MALNVATWQSAYSLLIVCRNVPQNMLFTLQKMIVDLAETRSNFPRFEEFFIAVHERQHASLLLALSLTNTA